jgi:hypothetical protein
VHGDTYIVVKGGELQLQPEESESPTATVREVSRKVKAVTQEVEPPEKRRPGHSKIQASHPPTTPTAAAPAITASLIPPA